MFRCVSETLPELIEKNENPMIGVILIIILFVSIGFFTLLKSN